MIKRKSNLMFTAAALTFALLVMLMVGCDSSSPAADDQTSGSVTVTVTATPVSISAGDYTVIEAVVSSDGTAMTDQEVTFTVLPSGAGSCTPTVDTTDIDGIAATMFTASASGSVSITATATGSGASGTAWVTVTQEGQTGSGSVSMTVTPSLLFADGEDTARVAILVRDANGDPAPDDVLVKICAGEKFVDLDGNGYWSQGIDSLVFDNNGNGLWDAVGSIPSTAYTSGGTGMAAVDFVSGSKAGTYYIKATVDEGGISGSAEQSIQLNPSAELHSIFLAAELMNVVVAHTGGVETSDLYATCYDVNGNPVPGGMAITFTILDGPDGGEFLGDDPLATEVTAITNSQGMATVPLHSGTVSGTIRIRAYSGTVLSNATQIMVSAGPPKYLVVGTGSLTGATYTCNVQYWLLVNARVGVVAVVSDTFLNPVNDSTVVYFSCDEGSMKSHEARTQDLEGVAGTEWISGNNVETADGIVMVYAETAGGTVADTTFFYNTSPLDSAWMVPDVLSIYADGKSEYLVTLFGEDVNDNPVIGGTKVVFESNDVIAVENAILEDGCSGSLDVVTVSSQGPLDYDYSMPGGDDDGIGGYVYVLGDLGAYAGGLLSMLTITLNTGFAYIDNCEIKSEAEVQQGSDLMISAVIKDRWGNPLGDHSLVMTVSDGQAFVGTAETDGYGEASGLIFRATTAATGTVTITVEDTDPRGGIFLTRTVTVN